MKIISFLLFCVLMISSSNTANAFLYHKDISISNFSGDEILITDNRYETSNGVKVGDRISVIYDKYLEPNDYGIISTIEYEGVSRYGWAYSKNTGLSIDDIPIRLIVIPTEISRIKLSFIVNDLNDTIIGIFYTERGTDILNLYKKG